MHKLLLATIFTITSIMSFAESLSGDVFKSPTCGCCNAWIEHMNNAGFALNGKNTAQLGAIKTQLGIPTSAQSCHSAVINDYVFEGHTPANVVKQFLDKPLPNAIGLSVPGMPVGSPGMEMGNRHDDYAVMVLYKDGSVDEYAFIAK
jgi:hypothetical protein